LNAVIRAVVKSACNAGIEVVGLEDSFDGLIDPSRSRVLTPDDVTGILRLGGTILGTTNHGNPFEYPVDTPEGKVDYSERVVETFHKMGLQALVVIGGDGSLSIAHQFYLKGKAATWEPWALEQVAQHDWRMVLEAGKAIGAYDARTWLAEVDVPASTIVTMRDHVVPVRRQIRLFQAIKDCEAFRIDGDHDAILAKREFPPLLARAVESVVERS